MCIVYVCKQFKFSSYSFFSLFCLLTHTHIAHKIHSHILTYMLIYSHSLIISPLALFFCQKQFWLLVREVDCSLLLAPILEHCQHLHECMCMYVCISICVCVCGCILVENNNFSDLRYVQTLDNGTNN